MTRTRERCNLKWQTYSDHLQQMLAELVDDEYTQDVTLVCDDQVKIKAHKFVLKACSHVFRMMFEEDKSPSSIVYLRGVNHEDMQAILQYLYLGEATFYQDRIHDFFKIAKDLDLKDVISEFDDNIPESKPEFQIENVVEASQLNKEIKTNHEEEFIEENNFTIPVNTILEACENNSLSCNQCSYQAKTEGALKIHMSSIHEELKYPCDQCDYRATQSGNLYRHVKSQHKTKFKNLIEKPESLFCKQCPYKATTVGCLKIHVAAIHENVKYPCYVCGYKATQIGNLYRHMRVRHNANVRTNKSK